MATIVGSLTLISMINTTSERLKSRKFFICQYLSSYDQLQFSCSVELSTKKSFITSRPCIIIYVYEIM